MQGRSALCGDGSDEVKNELPLTAGEVQMMRAKHTDCSADTWASHRRLALRKRKRNEYASNGSYTSVSPDRESRSFGPLLLRSGVRHYHDCRTSLLEITSGTHPGSFLFSDGSAHRRHGTFVCGRHGGGSCLCSS